MSLLTTMLQRPLDPGYAAAADRREADGQPRATSLRAPRLIIAMLVLGLLVGVAASNLTAADSPRAQARKDLIVQIEERRAEVDELTALATSLQSDVTELEAGQLGSVGDLARSRELAATVGAIPLEGPGLTITMDDAPGSGADEADGGSPEAEQGRVYAKDLRFVANALWESGAEAVSINGKRLTSLSAIRFAGSAVIVDNRPLTRPYVITALGDPARFPADFADGEGGTYLSTLRGNFGIRVDTKVARLLSVPAAVGLNLRHATTGDTEDTTPSTATPERSPS
ncbi:MAG TPA: DUF881 domain-containing protein [Ornithinibacter sp.]|nr:DUF881 domain-containing protein [Ornithinibacter sp.]